jgi:hypothetical protein
MARKKKPVAASNDNPAADLTTLVQRARQGDDAVLPQLREFLRDNPKIWTAVGDLARCAQVTWLNLLAGNDHLMKESVEKMLASMRDGLAGKSPTPLEMLLVDRIIACWLQLQYAEMQVAGAKDADPKMAAFYMKYQASAERRQLAAIRQLALVRRFLPAKAAAEEKVPVQANGMEKANGSKGTNGRAASRNGRSTRASARQSVPANRVKLFMAETTN